MVAVVVVYARAILKWSDAIEAYSWSLRRVCASASEIVHLVVVVVVRVVVVGMSVGVSLCAST